MNTRLSTANSNAILIAQQSVDNSLINTGNNHNRLVLQFVTFESDSDSDDDDCEENDDESSSDTVDSRQSYYQQLQPFIYDSEHDSMPSLYSDSDDDDWNFDESTDEIITHSTSHNTNNTFNTNNTYNSRM